MNQFRVLFFVSLLAVFSSQCLNRLNYWDVIDKNKDEATPFNLACVLIDLIEYDYYLPEQELHKAVEIFAKAGCSIRETYVIFNGSGASMFDLDERDRLRISKILLIVKHDQLVDHLDKQKKIFLCGGFSLGLIAGCVLTDICHTYFK